MSREVSTDAIIEVTFQGRADDQVTLSLFHYRLNNAIANSDGTALADQLHTALIAAGSLRALYLACCSNDFTLERMRYQWIYPTRYSAQDKAVGPLAGLIADVMAPSNIAAALLKRTFLTGRRQRGVLHMPGVAVGSIAGSVLTGAAEALYSALGVRVAGTITLAGDEVFEPVIFNKQFPVTSPTIQTVDPEHTARIMRRRTVGVGV